MSSNRVFNVKIAVEGTVRGPALVTSSPLSFMGGVDTEKGTFNHFLYPEVKNYSMAGRILIYPFGKGSTGDTIRLWRCVQNDVGPIGIINVVADPIIVQGAILANVPMVYGIKKSIFDFVKNDDLIKIDGNKVIVYKS